MKVVDRFLKYVSFETTSDSKNKTIPTTEGQRVFAEYLAQELCELGMEDVSVDSNSYVYGLLPGNNGGGSPCIAFVSHLDTSPAASGKNVSPRFIENYDGGDICLNKEKEMVLSPSKYPELLWYKGETLIVTDGNTLLGADDKAGIAEIMTMLQWYKDNPEDKHGDIEVVFMPDEEIGRSAKNFDVSRMKSQFGYTVDGGYIGKVQYENFNGASATVHVKGVKNHTGSAKNKMINSQTVAMEFHSLLPSHMVPEHTAGYEGFFYLDKFSGSVGESTLSYLIREHDSKKFENMKNLMKAAASFINTKYGIELVSVEITDSYYNMSEKVKPHLHLIDTAMKAMKDIGVEPSLQPIRGSTDGVELAFKGLPCPNLPTGGHNSHSEYEFITVESLEKMTQVLRNIVSQYEEKRV